MLEFQTVPGEKPQPLKQSTFRPEKFFKDLMKKKEVEQESKERSSVTVIADVHRDTPKETPRHPAAERKQRTPPHPAVADQWQVFHECGHS